MVKICGDDMKCSWAAASIAVALTACTTASAQSTSDILQRLGALEASNSKLQESNADLRKENAALRERMRRIETGKHTAHAAPMASVGSAPSTTKQSPPYAASAPFYKAIPPDMPPAFSWTGVYVGAHGGFGSARVAGADVHVDPHGGFGGIQMGVNYQFWGPWVLGFETDASFGNIDGSNSLCGVPGQCGTQGTIDFKVNALGSFRERVGYAWDRVLLYQTAGVAWAYAHPHIFVAACSPGDNGCVPGPFDDHRLMTGLAAGGGIEVAATSDLTFKVEYLYLDFPDKNFLVGTTQKGSADAYIQTVRVGANWLLH
jgi:outer membrane immunogenic protein